MKPSTKTGQSGQVALIVVLVMLVVGTIALSVASRSVLDVSISKQEENKIRAFSAAEAGIEDLLSAGIASVGVGGQRTVGNITYNYQISEVGASGYVLDEPLANGETIQINVDPAQATGLTVYWDNASLELSAFKTDGSIERVALNPAGSSITNGFTTAASGVTFQDKTYISRYDFNSLTSYSYIRIRALYNSTALAVAPIDGTLPAQAYNVKVNTGEGESAAAVEIVQSIGYQPGIFDYTLWSGGGLTK